MEDIKKPTEEEKPKEEVKLDFDKKLVEMREGAESVKAAIKELKDLKAMDALSGRTESGGTVIPKTPEQEKIEGAKEYFKGTQLEIDIKKANE